MTENKTYNGWTNYETWLVALWIDNTQNIADGAIAAVRRGEDLKWWVSEIFNLPRTGLGADLCNAALSEVNWEEVKKHLLSD